MHCNIALALVVSISSRQQRFFQGKIYDRKACVMSLSSAVDYENKKEKRLLAVSDVHVDDEKNMAWLESLEPEEGDSLIVAGDISDRLERIEAALKCLTAKYETVMYCYGNHEAWTNTEDNENSLEKLEKVKIVAEAAGAITTGTTKILRGPNRSCLVTGLHSWHHTSFDSEPPIKHWKGIPSARFVMTDYRRCKWPYPLRDDDSSIAEYMDSLNIPIEAQLQQEWHQVDDHITFSHFLPRIELLPEKRFLFLPTLVQAVGSSFLGRTIKRIQPDVHIFGHTHIAWDATHDKTRYIQAALGYSSEWIKRPASMGIGDFSSSAISDPSSLTHTTQKDEHLLQHHPCKPLLIWDSKNGGIVPNTYSTRWSDHYRRFPRVPELTHVLPPYLASIYKPLPGSVVLDVDKHVPPFVQE